MQQNKQTQQQHPVHTYLPAIIIQKLDDYYKSTYKREMLALRNANYTIDRISKILNTYKQDLEDMRLTPLTLTCYRHRQFFYNILDEDDLDWIEQTIHNRNLVCVVGGSTILASIFLSRLRIQPLRSIYLSTSTFSIKRIYGSLLFFYSLYHLHNMTWIYKNCVFIFQKGLDKHGIDNMKRIYKSQVDVYFQQLIPEILNYVEESQSSDTQWAIKSNQEPSSYLDSSDSSNQR